MKLMLHKLSQGGHIIGVGALTEGEYGLLCGGAYLHVAASSFLQLPQPMPVDHLHCIHCALHPYRFHNLGTFSVI
jgi:hypothetical protein